MKALLFIAAVVMGIGGMLIHWFLFWCACVLYIYWRVNRGKGISKSLAKSLLPKK